MPTIAASERQRRARRSPTSGSARGSSRRCRRTRRGRRPGGRCSRAAGCSRGRRSPRSSPRCRGRCSRRSAAGRPAGRGRGRTSPASAAASSGRATVLTGTRAPACDFWPIRPRGRQSRMTAMSTYITRIEPRGTTRFESPLTVPSRRPPIDGAPERADAADHHHDERRHHRLGADGRLEAPHRRGDHAGDARHRGPEREDQAPQPAEVDPERPHHLAVVRAGLDDGAVRRPLEEPPDERRAARPRAPRRGPGTRE